MVKLLARLAKSTPLYSVPYFRAVFLEDGVILAYLRNTR
jgi:hypothetical protein